MAAPSPRAAPLQSPGPAPAFRTGRSAPYSRAPSRGRFLQEALWPASSLVSSPATPICILIPRNHHEDYKSFCFPPVWHR